MFDKLEKFLMPLAIKLGSSFNRYSGWLFNHNTFNYCRFNFPINC